MVCQVHGICQHPCPVTSLASSPTTLVTHPSPPHCTPARGTPAQARVPTRCLCIGCALCLEHPSSPPLLTNSLISVKSLLTSHLIHEVIPGHCTWIERIVVTEAALPIAWRDYGVSALQNKVL